MITPRYYEDMMKELSANYKDNPADVRAQMDRINIETLACLGYSAGAKIYAKTTGVKLKNDNNC